MDTTRGEWVEKELNLLIERRHDQRVRTDGERVEEELWMESERCYLEIKRRQSVAAWFAYFCRMRDNHARLSEDYQRRAEALCEEGSGGG